MLFSSGTLLVLSACLLGLVNSLHLGYSKQPGVDRSIGAQHHVVGVVDKDSAVEDSAVGKRHEREELCNEKALNDAWEHMEKRNFSAVQGNPCVRDQIVTDLLNGERDPEDNFEFMGKDKDRLATNTTALPSVVFIGTPHSGSGSLAEQMNEHPELSYGKMKDHNMLWKMGAHKIGEFKEAYQTFFPRRNHNKRDDIAASKVKIMFDGSAENLFIGNAGDFEMSEQPLGKFHGTGEAGAKAVRHLLGRVTKFIFMVRDPLDWQYSMEQDLKDSDEYLTLQNASLVGNRSCYVESLQSWVSAFAFKNFIFIDSYEYFTDPQGTLDKIFEFLRVSPYKYKNKDLTASGRRRSGRRPTDSARMKFWSDEINTDCVVRLERLTRRSYDWGKTNLVYKSPLS